MKKSEIQISKDNGTETCTGEQKALFTRKAIDLNELKRRSSAECDKKHFVIEKIIDLGKEAFTEFSENLMEDFYFIKENKNFMYIDTDRVWHCILIKETGSNNGILVESEGYDYARYSGIYTKK